MRARWFPRAWRLPVVATALLVAGGVLLLGARAEGQTEEGATPPQHEVHVDGIGVLERAPWTVRVEKGDTIGAIAQRHLGTTRRSAEILELNPRVNPKALRVGQPLVLPPRTSTGWVDLYAAVAGGIAQPVGLGAPALLPWGPVTVFAVPHVRVEALRALDRDRQLVEPLLRADTEVARSAPFDPAPPATAGLARVISKVRIQAQRGHVLELRVLDQHLLSSTGHRLVPAHAEDQARGGLLVPLVLVLAGLIVSAFIALAARRLGGSAQEGDPPRNLA